MKVVGQQQIADWFGVTRETIDTWQNQGFPIAVRGGPGVPSEYDSRACIDWLIDRELNKAGTERPQDRLARAQAEKIEMENAERRMQLVRVDEIEPMMIAAAVYARERLLEAVPRLARDLSDDVRQREETLQAEFEAFLHYMADWGEGANQKDEGDA